ncbi:hypothetical protein TNCV_3861541 [Trichonephila clavipes]|nr:hypothetical protein TNCV_3861541 [Trichonephila clavipes]
MTTHELIEMHEQEQDIEELEFLDSFQSEHRMTKKATESHQMLVEAYGGNALSRAQCYRWFEKFQNGDFDMRNEERGRPAKKFEDAELQALLDEDDGQTQEHLA